MMNRYVPAIVATLALLGCADQSLEKYQERAQAEQKAGTEVENDNLSRRAKLMENDLRRRYRFYKGVSIEYQGQFSINNNRYRAKLTFVPTLHIVETDRVRTLEEIQDDLNNLFLNAQVVIWSETANIGVNGCVFEKVKPDVNNGWIQLLSSECATRFLVKLTIGNATSSDRDQMSAYLAKALLEGSQTEIEYLHMDVSSKFNPNGYEVLVKKVE